MQKSSFDGLGCWCSIAVGLPALLIIVGMCSIARTQETPPAPSPPPASDSSSPARPTGPPDSIQPKNDRIFGVLPNYRTVEHPTVSMEPLTAKEKFKLAAEDSFDPYAYPVAGIFAGVAQAQNSPTSWRQGWGAFAKRYAASFADQTDENIMTEAVVPALLKEDPRYFRMGQGSFLKRSGYAMSRIWITRRDAGGRTFNWSEIGGAAGSVAISNLYYPAESRTLSRNLSGWGTLVAEDTFFNLLKEYWPDIRHKVLKR